MGVFGILKAGTPDDMIAYIESLQRQSGGFGCLDVLGAQLRQFRGHQQEL